MEEEPREVYGGSQGGRLRPSRSGTLFEEVHWRKAQRARRRRMTLRGRFTLAAAAGLAGVALFWLLNGLLVPWLDGPEPSAAPVAAREGEEPERAERATPASAARDLFARLPVTPDALELPGDEAAEASGSLPGRLYEWVPAPAGSGLSGPLRVEYTLEAELTREVFRALRQGRVKLGHVILLDPHTGRVLAYASTDVSDFPPTRAYPAASLVKVITAAAALDLDPLKARLPCRYRGSPYRLTSSRLDPPKSGRTISLRRALATSNNQCFAQLAVHAVGAEALLEAIARFGWLSPPAVAHAAGTVDPGGDRLGVGKLGCGLAGCRITPLHAAQLAATLAHGELVAPRWIERVVDAEGRELPLPAVPARTRVLSPGLAAELRGMLVDTTRSGTARRAFHKRNGHPLLGPVRVAGKTGSLSGKGPRGRYEWFVGVAPAEQPAVAVAVLLVQGRLWWRNASQVAAEVLRSAFCSKGSCRAEGVARWARGPDRLDRPPDGLSPVRAARVSERAVLR